MSTVRGQSEAVLNWQEWFLNGDPVATQTHFTARCWPNKSDPTEFNWQRHHVRLSSFRSCPSVPVHSRQDAQDTRLLPPPGFTKTLTLR